jgi:putative transposase
MDSQILLLYAKGMITRGIVSIFKEMYDTDVSPTLISKVTDAVKWQVAEWQNCPLDAWMWLAENEGAKFWLSVLTELKNRGLQDILIACVD